MSIVTSTTKAGADTVTAANNNDQRTDDLHMAGDYATSTGSANAYILALDAEISALTTGGIYKFKANFANTGAATININSIGVTSIKKNTNVALEANDIESGQIVVLRYDGTNFQLTAGSFLSKSDATDLTDLGVTSLHSHDENFTVWAEVGNFVNNNATVEGIQPVTTHMNAQVSYADAASQSGTFTLKIPKGATGIASISIITRSGSGTGDVVWNFETDQLTTAGAVSHDATGTNLTQSVVSGSYTKTAINADNYSGLSIAEDGLLNIFVERVGADGADTLTSTAHVPGLVVVFS